MDLLLVGWQKIYKFGLCIRKQPSPARHQGVIDGTRPMEINKVDTMEDLVGAMELGVSKMRRFYYILIFIVYINKFLISIKAKMEFLIVHFRLFTILTSF